MLSSSGLVTACIITPNFLILEQFWLRMVIINSNEDANFLLMFERELALRKYNIKQTEDNPWLVIRHSFTSLKNVNNTFKKEF